MSVVLVAMVMLGVELRCSGFRLDDVPGAVVLLARGRLDSVKVI